MPVNLFVIYRKYFFLLLLLGITGPALRAQIPDSLLPQQQNPARLVNDYAGILNASEKQWLEDKLVDFDKTSSNQVCVVIVKTIADHDIAGYATTLGRRWGIGEKGKNNGVLIVAAMETHDINISPGYGLEGALPDVLCKQIIENEIVPSFKQGYYYEGLDKATTVIIAATKGEFTADGPYGSQKTGMPKWLIILLLIVGINGFFLIFIPLVRRLFYYLIGQKPPRRKQREWTFSNTVASAPKDERVYSNSSSSNDFGGYGGGSFGGGGASGKW